MVMGRPALYGVSAGGQARVEKALALLKEEMRRTMAYLGKQRVCDIGPDIFLPPAG